MNFYLNSNDNNSFSESPPLCEIFTFSTPPHFLSKAQTFKLQNFNIYNIIYITLYIYI